MYGDVPPDADAVAPPSNRPLQVTLESTCEAATKTVGSVTVDELVEVQPFASVTVTVYVPAATPVIDAVVAVFDHAYVYGDVPPVADAVAPPSDNPLQVMVESTCEAATNTVGSVTVDELVEVQPFASVTVTVYVPADKLLAVAVVAPLDHA